jgi:hypothetical protein
MQRVEGKRNKRQTQKGESRGQCDRQDWYASLGRFKGSDLEELGVFIQMFQLS